MHSKKLLLAVDGGGSKTKVLLTTEQGEVVGEGLSGPTNIMATGHSTAKMNLTAAIKDATSEVDADSIITCAAMGLSGADSEQDLVLAQDIFQPVFNEFKVQDSVIVNDIKIALLSGTTNANAVALISGTGSNCFGQNESGDTAKTGGMDFLLTDQGSGYAIGRQVLREAVKSFDGRSPKSILERLVCEYFSIESIASLKEKVYNPLLSKPEIAALSKLCTKAAQKDDAVAIAILEKAARDLAEMVSVVAEQLGFQVVPFDVITTGSIATLPRMQQMIKDEVGQRCQNVSFIIPDQEPVFGAVTLAQQHL